jgi:Xaa-Pro dipeptidase
VHTQNLYREHLERLNGAIGEFLERQPELGTGIVFHAGRQHVYHRDDRDVPFRPDSNFARFCPIPGPDHLLLCRPGHRPRLVLVVPGGYWYEPAAMPEHPFTEMMEVITVDRVEAAAKALGSVIDSCYVGNDPRTAERLSIAARRREPSALMTMLDWSRSFKTGYEVECIRGAAQCAAAGHAAVREAAQAAICERELHALYLQASGQLENDCPYTNIIAWDEHAATLHYSSKSAQPPRDACTLLIDAGGTQLGYASDVTRTYLRKNAHPVFRELLDRLDQLQRSLVLNVRAGLEFIELHEQAHRGVAEILCELGIVLSGVDEALERGLTLTFLPHGLGHHMGLQVHDVGGRQIDAAGTLKPSPPRYPHLRTTRHLEVGHVVTIEPGIYFIPSLLEPLRQRRESRLLDWTLIDRLTNHGGVRIEDDVLVTKEQAEDLTRPLIPGHSD